MRRLKVVAIILAVGVLLAGGNIAASAQPDGVPPLPPTPPPGLAIAPPCDIDLALLPDQARVPCLGITAFAEGTTADDRASIVQGAGASLRFNYDLVNAAAVLVPDEQTLSALLSDPNIVALIPDRPIHAIARPDAPGQGGGKKPGGGGQVVPSGVQRIGAAPCVGCLTGAGVGVAVVDTGVDASHPDLSVAADCFDAFAGDCPFASDGNGHGTHVAGIVAALHNEIDVVGVAPGATVYSVKVLNDNGSGSDSTVMAGLDWVAAANAISVSPPIRVVNMSLGRPGTLNDNPALRASVQALHEGGISIVVAAGNDATKEVKHKVPATYPEVMAVASSTAADGTNKCGFFSGFIAADTASYFTTDGAYDGGTGIGVTISAPGEKQEDINRGCLIKSVGILSLKVGGGTTRMIGTSMAAPHVTGVVARMLQNQALEPEPVRTAIRTNAALTGEAPFNSPTSSYTFDGELEGIVQAP